MNKRNTFWYLNSKLLIWLLLLFSFFYGAYNNHIFTGKTQIIKWDGYGYYLYLPAVFIHQDATRYDFAKEDLKKYPISSALYQLQKLNDSTYFPTYPIGMAILWYPFFQVAHFYCLMQSHYPADGQSFPYQLSIFFAAIFYMGIGLFYLRKFLLHFVNDQIVSCVIMAIFFGTNFYFYQLYGKELTHIYLFSLLAIYLYHWQRYVMTNRNKYLYFASSIFVLGVLIRNSELFWLLIPMAYQLNTLFVNFKANLLAKSKVLFIHLFVLLTAYFVCQMGYFKLTTNHWWLNGYADHTFNLLKPAVYNCLFSISKGWFVYTPFAALFFIGWYWIYTKQRQWFASVVVYSICTIYLLICWSDWTYGSTFSFRPIVQSYALFSLPLALLFMQLAKNTKWKFVAVTFITACCSLNIFQSWQYEKDIIDRQYQNWVYYKRVFLKPNFDASDKILLDIPQHQFKKYSNTEILYESKQAVLLKGAGQANFKEYENVYSTPYQVSFTKDKRIQTTMVLSYYNDYFSFWETPRFVTDISDTISKKNIYWTGLKLPFVLRNKKYDTLVFNQPLQMKPSDKLTFFFHNNTLDSVIVHNIEIALVE